MKINLCLALVISLICFDATAKLPAFGRPGLTPNWSSAKKVHVGTSYGIKTTPLWFTLAKGALSEVYFPTIDQAQIKDSQLMISDGKTFALEEKKETSHQVKVLSPYHVELINYDKSGRFKVTHEYFVDPQKDRLIEAVKFEAFQDHLDVYLLTNTSLNRSGFDDNAKVNPDKTLTFWQDKTRLRVWATVPFTQASVGYEGVSEGYADLKDNLKLTKFYDEALRGNVSGMAKLALPKKRGVYHFKIVYDFEKTPSKDFELAKKGYMAGWENYLQSLDVPSSLATKEKDLFYRSYYVLATHEDKLNPGAMIASLSKPWGEKYFERRGETPGGYHLVWPRDLFHVGLALLLAGDTDRAKRSMDFLASMQYKSGTWFYGDRIIERKGSFPQNVWVDRRDYWGNLQLDQVGFSVQLFYQIYKRLSYVEKRAFLKKHRSMLKDSLDFIQKYGPWSAQERWEENFGISPSTFSIATSALLIGAKVLNIKSYQNTAKGWLTKPGDNIHTWTYATKSPYKRPHYVRVAGCSGHMAPWRPSAYELCHVANSSLRVDQRLMLDQGFLKLALLGLVDANDERLINSKKLVDKVIRENVGGHSAWYRYRFDSYGEDGVAGMWPLLSSEHGRFALERMKVGSLSRFEAMKEVNTIIQSYLFFANDGEMIPEQIDNEGKGIGAATPLAWSHAEYLKLIWSRELEENVENPF